MNQDELRERLLQFAIRIIKLGVSLPGTPEGRVVRGQIIRSGTSPGAQYREACRSRSQAESVSKIEAAAQELDETDYWLLILERTGMIKPGQLAPLQDETRQLLRIFAASAKTAKNEDDRLT